VVMDFVLPAMNGVTLAERIRRRRPNLPVLYCSAYPQITFGRYTGEEELASACRRIEEAARAQENLAA